MTDYLDDDPHLRRNHPKFTKQDEEHVIREACGLTEEWTVKEKYPLIKELGFSPWVGADGIGGKHVVVSAIDLERILEKGVKRYSFGGQSEWYEKHGLPAHSKELVEGLIINIQPIKPKSKEVQAMELLKELVEGLDNGGFQYGSVSKDFKAKARRLIEGEKGE